MTSSIVLAEVVSTSVPSPPSGYQTLFVDTNGNLKQKNSDGSIQAPAGAPVVVSSASGTITPDASISNNFEYLITGNLTIANPTGTYGGQVLRFLLTEDATGGHTISFGTNFLLPAVVALTTTANAVNLAEGYVTSTGTIVVTYGRNL